MLDDQASLFFALLPYFVTMTALESMARDKHATPPAALAAIHWPDSLAIERISCIEAGLTTCAELADGVR